MSKYMAKPKFVDAFEYGSGEFPMWFNMLVGNLVKLFDDCVYTPEGKLHSPAGRIGRRKVFNYGDIIVKHTNGKVQVYEKYDFLEKYYLIS